MVPVDTAVELAITPTATTTPNSSLRGRGLTLRLGGRGGIRHPTTRVSRYILRDSAVRSLPGARLPAARDGRRAAELDGLLTVVGRFVLVLGLGLPVAEVVFGIIQDLAGLGAVCIWLAIVTRHDGTVVQELEEAAAVAGQDDLLLGALDRGEELGVVGFLQLLTGLARRHTTVVSFLAPTEGFPIITGMPDGRITGR